MTDSTGPFNVPDHRKISAHFRSKFEAVATFVSHRRIGLEEGLPELEREG